MASLDESAVYEPSIYQLETTDDVEGGAGGTSNIQATQLANRTTYLKTVADEVVTARGAAPSLGQRLAAADDLVEQMAALASITTISLYL